MKKDDIEIIENIVEEFEEKLFNKLDNLKDQSVLKANKPKEKHTHIILLAETHKQLKMMAAHRDISISALIEELSQQYISEKGKF